MTLSPSETLIISNNIVVFSHSCLRTSVCRVACRGLSVEILRLNCVSTILRLDVKVCYNLYQICLEWNDSLHKGQWSGMPQILLWLMNKGVLWNMGFPPNDPGKKENHRMAQKRKKFPEWPRKNNNFPDSPKLAIVAVTNKFKMMKSSLLLSPN